MCVHILPQLVVVGRKLGAGIPADALCVGFHDDVIVVGHGAHEVTGISDALAVLFILYIVIDIDGRILHLPETFHLVYIMEVGHKAVGDKLVFTLVFIYKVALPIQKIGHFLPVIAFPFILVRGACHSIARIELFPGVDVHSPVVHSPFLGKQIQVIVEFLFDVVPESEEIVSVVYSARFCFVVHLIPDDCRMLCISFQHLADNPFAIELVGRVCKIHVLSDSIIGFVSFGVFCQHFRVFVCQPCRNGIGGSSQDDFDSCCMHLVQNAVHPFKFKISFLRLKYSPGRFSNAHYCQAGSFHQPDIFIQSLIGHIFMIVGCTIKHVVE